MLFPLDTLSLEKQDAVTAAIYLNGYNVEGKKSTILQTTSEDN